MTEELEPLGCAACDMDQHEACAGSGCRCACRARIARAARPAPVIEGGIPRIVCPDDVVLDARAAFLSEVALGHRVVVHALACLGSPPFSYVAGVPKPRLGTVVLGDDVEVMPFANIDRGTERATTIGSGSKIDRFVHVAHDSVLGARCILAAGTIVGGWCELGDDVYCGINVSIKPRVKIGAAAKIGAGTVVLHDVAANAVMVGNPARFLRWRG